MIVAMCSPQTAELLQASRLLTNLGGAAINVRMRKAHLNALVKRSHADLLSSFAEREDSDANGGNPASLGLPSVPK